MTQKIVFLDRSTFPIHIEFREPNCQYKWQDYELTETEQVVDRLKEATLAVSNKVVIDRLMLEQLPNLKHIAVIATGYNNIDIDACQEHGVSVSNIQRYAETSVPEHAMAMIFGLRRHLLAYQIAVEQGEWQRSEQFCYYHGQTSDIAGSQLGIIGGGDLGQAMAALAKAVGMKVVFAERKGSDSSGREHYQSFEQVVEESDVISLHCPLNAETENLITATELKSMKPTALLINTARGGIVNEADITTAIKNNWIAGAGFDVASKEPIDAQSPLLSIVDRPNFILTPHVAWSSDTALQTQADQLVDIIEAFDQGDYINRII